MPEAVSQFGVGPRRNGNRSLKAAAAALHFSLTPGFSRVPAQAQERSRLNGFRSTDPLITGLKSGVNASHPGGSPMGLHFSAFVLLQPLRLDAAPKLHGFISPLANHVNKFFHALT
jgi:hypothetical protein